MKRVANQKTYHPKRSSSLYYHTFADHSSNNRAIITIKSFIMKLL